MSALEDTTPPLGIGVVGLGRAGAYHLERLALRGDCRLVAAYDDCPPAAKKASGLVTRLAEGWSELLRDESVELVIVATPPASHAALAIEALAAGKHVLVETPLCLDVPAADAIGAASRRHGRSVIVAQTHRWDGEFLTLRKCIESGALGRVRSIQRIRWQYNRRPSGAALLSPRTPADRPDDFPPHRWRDDSATGGGALWEFGIHELDQLLKLVGEAPFVVSAELEPGLPPSRIEAGYSARIRFPSGIQARVEFNGGSPAALQTGWVAAGSEGTFANGMLFSVTGEGEVVDEPLVAVKGEPDSLYAAIVAHVRRGEPNPVPIDDARRTVALIAAVRRSATRGAPVPVEDSAEG